VDDEIELLSSRANLDVQRLTSIASRAIARDRKTCFLECVLSWSTRINRGAVKINMDFSESACREQIVCHSDLANGTLLNAEGAYVGTLAEVVLPGAYPQLSTEASCKVCSANQSIPTPTITSVRLGVQAVQRLELRRCGVAKGGSRATVYVGWRG